MRCKNGSPLEPREHNSRLEVKDRFSLGGMWFQYFAATLKHGQIQQIANHTHDTVPLHFQQYQPSARFWSTPNWPTKKYLLSKFHWRFQVIGRCSGSRDWRRRDDNCVAEVKLLLENNGQLWKELRRPPPVHRQNLHSSFLPWRH